MQRKLALVRKPSPRLADGITTHIDPTPIDVALALHQWESYVATLKAHGWHVVEAPETPDCPDGVFIEDQVVVYGDRAMLCRSGSPIRQAEQVGLKPILEAHGYQCVEMAAPNTLDGGDVLKHDGMVWVGHGPEGRSNSGGISALAHMVNPLGAKVVPVEVTKALHLKSAVTALPDGTVLGWPPVVDDQNVWDNYLAVPEEPGAHVVILDATTLLMAASAPATAQIFEDRGYQVVTCDISEFEKLEGCVTCLSVRLRG